jgi:hypothetical protein
MKQVVARRDDNWKKLQQYIFDEREQLEMRGAQRVPIWGERREYTWFIRDGFFVRSPTKFNGVTIGDAERRKFEADYLKQAQERDKRAPRANSVTLDGSVLTIDGGTGADTPERPADQGLTQDVSGVIRQNRQPQFISSAYFLRFKFEEGKYALVGHETIDGREVLRIEYYPERMFSGTDRRRTRKETSDKDRARDAEFQRLMNKVALVTATMTVGQPFPDVWLPTSMEINLAMTLALGQIDVHYGLEYHDYRVPSVTSKVGVK